MEYKYLAELISRYPSIRDIRDSIEDTCNILINSFRAGGKLLVAGNGGSAADSDHVVGELMKGFLKKRPLDGKLQKSLLDADSAMGGVLASSLQSPLPAISLTSHIALSTAFVNDCDPVLVFAQQIFGYGKKGDVFLAISTSGNSKNLLYAAVAAKALGMKVVGLTGETGGKLASYSDVCIKVPAKDCYKIQELHLPVYHSICLTVEDTLFDE